MTSTPVPWLRDDGIETLDEARTGALAASRTLVQAGPLSCRADELRVLEETVVPPPDSEPNPYLALHFDRGHPLFPTRAEPVVLTVALFRPLDGPRSTARTRLVSVQSLVEKVRWGEAEELESRLRAYADSHGSSWDWDDSSGHRVSCFARIVDAASPQEPCLTSFRETPRSQWYAASKAGHEFSDLQEELAFYRDRGVALDSEDRVELRPGELLVIDNVRAVHGRVGARVPGELHQLLIGPSPRPPGEIARIRSWIVDAMAEGPA